MTCTSHHPLSIMHRAFTIHFHLLQLDAAMLIIPLLLSGERFRVSSKLLLRLGTVTVVRPLCRDVDKIKMAATII